MTEGAHILNSETIAAAVKAALGELRGVQAVVCGDLLLDEYIWGEADRISPEAPVPVVRVQRQEVRLGGAANVARNVAALGGDPHLVGVVGADATGEEIRTLWAAEGRDPGGLITDPDRITPRKTRVLAGGQQMLRVDREAVAPGETGQREALLAHLEVLRQRVQVILFSDYQKGTLGALGIAAYVAAADGLPILANPKPASARLFAGGRLLTLNRSEALGLLQPSERGTPLEQAGEALRQELGIPELLITRGGEGMTLFTADGAWHVPAVASEVFDVTGAGDTVLAALGLALGARLESALACVLATYAAGVVVRKVGVAIAEPGEVAALAASRPIQPTWTPVQEPVPAVESALP